MGAVAFAYVCRTCVVSLVSDSLTTFPKLVTLSIHHGAPWFYPCNNVDTKVMQREFDLALVNQ